MQGSCSNAQHFTCPAYYKDLFSEASIVHRAKKTLLKASPASPYFKSWSLSRLQISSTTNTLTVPVFLTNGNTSFFICQHVVKDYTDIFLNKKQTKGKH